MFSICIFNVCYSILNKSVIKEPNSLKLRRGEFNEMLQDSGYISLSLSVFTFPNNVKSLSCIIG